MRLYRYLILLLMFVSLYALISPATSANQVTDARVAKSYGKLPLSFVENRGQMDKRARFVIRGPRASAFFRNDGVTFDLWKASKKKPLNKRDILQRVKPEKPPKPEVRKHAVLKLNFKGADPKCQVKGMDSLTGKVNYMIGKDKLKWHTDVPTFKGVIYKNVWSGIDIMYRGDRRQLKYDIRVNPGADIRKVRLQYDGAQRMWLDKKGTLHIKTTVIEFIEKVPGIYQEKASKKIKVTGGYKLLDAHTVGFDVKNADPKLPLVIDPASDLVYSTFLGGTNLDYGYSIAVDSSGCAYVTGYTESSDFPTTPSAFDTSIDDWDTFVTKLNASGSGLEYSTFLGGTSGDCGYSIAVDSSGCAYVTGETGSSDFPTTPGAFDTSFDGGSYDAFATKLNTSGSGLEYSTFLGGTTDDYGCNIAIDSSGCAYVTGLTSSSDFPTTPGAFDTSFDIYYSDAFVTKLNISGSGLEYSTFLGGTSYDSGYNIAVDLSGCAYVTGETASSDFPTTPGAFDTSYGGSRVAFATKLNASGSGLEYSTFLGGTSDQLVSSIAVDSSGCAYVTGLTSSSDFPTTPEAFDTSLNGSSDAFATKLNASGSGLEYSTFLGGTSDDYGRSITVDSSGCAYVTGYTASSDFPTTPGAFDTSLNGSSDAFATKLNTSGSGLEYSTYLGGTSDDFVYSIAVDSSGCAYMTGLAWSLDFPTTPGAFDTSRGGSSDVIVVKFDFRPIDTTLPSVTINQASGQADPTGVSPINFTVVFSEAVDDFATGDVTLSGTAGARLATVTGSGTTYNVAVRGMSKSGAVIASVSAGVAHNALGNANLASVSADNQVTYNALPAGYLIAWGDNSCGKCNVPTGNDFVAVVAGLEHNVALKSDGSLAAWGDNNYGQCDVPAGSNFTAVATGAYHGVVLKSDGSLAAWGWNNFNQCNIPAGNDFVTVAAGVFYSAALKSDGSLIAWGENFSGQCNVPLGNNFVEIAAGWEHSVALKSDGSLTAWGYNYFNQCNVPAGNDFAEISAARWHNIALKSDGSLAAWGFNDDGRCNVPAGNDFMAIAAGQHHNVVLKSDGSLVAWGDNYYNQCNVPHGNNFMAIAAAASHSVAISAIPPSPTMISISPNTATNTSAMSITNLAGIYFLSGATAKLTKTGETDIEATNVSVVSSTQIVCDFDLIGKTLGVWDVVVINPDFQSATLPGGFTITDGVSPTVTINQDIGQADPTGVSPINFTVMFSEPVSDFVMGDVALSGTAGATTATVTGSNTTYNVAVTGMTGSGSVIASIAVGAAHDVAGNSNTESTSIDNEVTYYISRPDMLIKAGTESTYTGTGIFNVDGTEQTKSQNAAPGQKVTYAFKVKNSGIQNDSFKITGLIGGSGWSVKYYDLSTGVEVTSQVTGAGWSSGTLTPGATKGIFVNVKSDATLSLGSTNTLLIKAESEADDSKIDVVKAVTTFTGIYKTDMLIKSGPDTSYSGAGTYSTDGANQTKMQNVCAGQKVTYGFRARNGGNAIDSFRITGPAGGSGWSVKYYDFTTSTDVTSQVTGAGWVSSILAPGTMGGVFVNIKPDSTVPIGSSITLTMTGTSMSDNTKIDVVKAVTICVASYKPDLLIKLGTESIYSGLDIFNTDGTDQTKTQNAAINQKVTCSFRVKNAGYLSDSFKITGPGGGSGWTVKYIDLASGADVTSQVTGTGWLSGTMAPGTDKGVYAKITPDATVTSGSSKTLNITAASITSPTKIDVVKAVTTVP